MMSSRSSLSTSIIVNHSRLDSNRAIQAIFASHPDFDRYARMAVAAEKPGAGRAGLKSIVATNAARAKALSGQISARS